ncbi:MAG: N(4)-(beta-N-acetylglucosaminyl)-L-asparaginase [Verrucomicrobia bacterium]|nr:N(4)-(beta-N-acetylglucosaminyl)-L-asparaginase [Verrucomicrobiota bacterium]
MSQQHIKRRDFIQGAALAGLSAPLIGREAFAQGAANQNARAGSASPTARPVVFSSANGANVPKRGVTPAGINCIARAMEIIKAGGDTLDAVIAGVNIVEDDPDDTSVGYGGLPNEEGDVELDSCVMHGPSRRAGAVASLRHIKNPSKVAKVVLERTDHILLVGEGALRFALKHGFKKEELLTEESREAWLRWKERLNPGDAWGPSPIRTVPSLKSVNSNADLTSKAIAFNAWVEDVITHPPTGTINCLAVDAKGDLSGVTTTSGLAWKIPGRVGDSPLIGCGLYVDNEVGAAGSTGRGEECIYINGAHTVVEGMRRGLSPTEAALEAMKRVAARYGNDQAELAKFNLSFYAVNKRGEYGASCLWKGGRFAVHDGQSSKVLDSAHLFERKPA